MRDKPKFKTGQTVYMVTYPYDIIPKVISYVIKSVSYGNTGENGYKVDGFIYEIVFEPGYGQLADIKHTYATEREAYEYLAEELLKSKFVEGSHIVVKVKGEDLEFVEKEQKNVKTK